MDKQKLIEELKRDEGVRFKPYHCSADKLTIGVGRNLDDVGISEAESDFLLANDIDNCVSELKRTFNWYEGLSNVRQRVMINMCFNLGLSRLMNFKNFLGAVESKDYTKAGVEMLDSKWARQVGPRATRLKDMMVEG
jgi:lysozyme|tara:strand:- start:707 stop:1117 length:411 start_codon:yes stop_codon:yes gene_type:complete